MTSSLTRGLARILHRPVDDRTRRRAALHLLDWLGCALAGSREPAGRVLAARASGLPRGAVTVLGAAPVANPEEAAFVNGGLGNIYEMDDVHRTAILHPGPVTVPAALSAAEAMGAEGAALLDALVRGYEAVIRLGAAVGPGHYALWHNTATCGPFGSAAAVASLLGLDEDATVWALGNAGTQASGPWRCRHEAVMTKQLHTARAAQAGYAAAALAGLGFTGPEFILEGEQGFFAAMCPDGDPRDVVQDPDADWKLWETSFKPWPACRHAHPAIDAALILRERDLPELQAIDRIEVATYRDAVVFCDRPEPATTVDAKFSLQHAVALVLADGPPDLAGFEPAEIARPDLAALRARTSVSVADDLDRAYPRHFGAEVRLHLASGATDTARVADALGDPENPLSEDRIAAKADMLMTAAGLPTAHRAAIAEAALALAEGGPVAALTSALSLQKDLP